MATKIMFEWTCAYGMKVERPIVLLFASILLFAPFYYLAISQAQTINDPCVYELWEEDIPGKPEHRASLWKPAQSANRRVATAAFALYFALLSAFQFGWKEFSIRSWIEHVNPRESTLRARGWVRSVAGLQALFGLYMVVLWIFLIFSNPFASK
jgi:hypothetical protein